MQGWVKLQRSILQQAVRAKPPEYYKIYSYLVVSVDRISGEFYTTYQTIADTCMVKKSSVDNFLRRAKEAWLLKTEQKTRWVVITLQQNLGFFNFEVEENPENNVTDTTTQITEQITAQNSEENPAQELEKSNDAQPPITEQITTQNTICINKNSSTSVEVDRAKALSISTTSSTSFLKIIQTWQTPKKWWSIKKKEYGKTEVNLCLELIKSANGWTLEGTQKNNRIFAAHLVAKLKQEDGVISWERTREQTLALLLKMVVQSADIYWLPKISSPAEIYNNLNKLKAFVKAYVVKTKAKIEKETVTSFKSF